MRELSAATRAQLAATDGTWARLVRLARADGVRLGFTDHDAGIVMDGLTHAPANGLRLGAVEAGATLSSDVAAIEGVLKSDHLDADDLASGLWDGAGIEIWRCDWRDPARRYLLFSGRLGGVRVLDGAFAAEVRGPQAQLDVVYGRVYARGCDAALGDARCGVSLVGPPFLASAVVAEVRAGGVVALSTLQGYEPGWFAFGQISKVGGPVLPIRTHDRDGELALLTLGAAHNFAPGESVSVKAGCDKTAKSCASKFANMANFRGFPHMPGADAVIAHATAAPRRDGGSRGLA